MPSIQIRNLSDEVYKKLASRAKEDRRSLQQEAAWLLEAALAFPGFFHQPRWDAADRVQEAMAQRYGSMPDSTPLIREMRDSR